MTEALQVSDQNFIPRDYQCDMPAVMSEGVIRRAYLVWNRRAGKDKDCWFFMGSEAMMGRVGNYAYVFPQQNQARRNLWTNVDGAGFRTIDHIPKKQIKRRLESEMFIELKSGSTIQVLGADKPANISALRGGNWVGVVLSEWAWMNPTVWDVLRPILAENGGWIIFNTTPYGPNHAKAMWEMARDDDHWFTQFLTVDDTQTMTQDQIDQEWKEIAAVRGDSAADAEIAREYYCSWDVLVEGAYYSGLMATAEREGRVGEVPWIPNLPVETWWDIGIGADDSSAIWFVQALPGGYHVIEYREWNQQGLPEIAKDLKDMPYVWGTFVVPHDMKSHEWGRGKQAGTRLDAARRLFPNVTFSVAPKYKVEDGIEAARALIPRCRWDEKKTKLGVDAIKNYHKKYDEDRRIYQDHPYHDWSSHGADAFRYGAVGSPHSPKVEPKEEPEFPGVGAPGGGGWAG